MQTLKSTDAMAKAMAGATKSMAAMNKRMNLPALQQIMKEFEKQNAKMDMVEEMMGDAMDDVFEARLYPPFARHVATALCGASAPPLRARCAPTRSACSRALRGVATTLCSAPA